MRKDNEGRRGKRLIAINRKKNRAYALTRHQILTLEDGLKPGGGAKRLARTKDGAHANMARHGNQISGTESPPCRRRRVADSTDGGEGD